MAEELKIKNIEKAIRRGLFRVRNFRNEHFQCPICQYQGPFKDLEAPTGFRKNAICPNCGSYERHRIQFLVLEDLFKKINTSQMKILHFAPEAYFREFLSKRFGNYETADFNMKDVDHKVDIQQLPFPDAQYDFVFASHVLEHIPDDNKAISEIRRILKPGGIAILPVPIISAVTVEYPEPNPIEHYHVRAPGMDYFEKYKLHFSRVERFDSASLPLKYQLFMYEDRTKFPTALCPRRTPMQGTKHSDCVPVCYV